jgi:chromosome segregation ATPase
VVVVECKKIQILFQDKDVELDKMHKMFKQTSKQVDDMNGVLASNQKYEEKLKSSEIELKRLKEDLEKRDEPYEKVVSERNELKSHLCQLAGVEELLRKLKARADEADRLELELANLSRSYQRLGPGAAGDELSVKRVQSACKQCHKYANELAQSESMLEAEIKRNDDQEAERRFLRERVRSIDVMEAELILFKVCNFYSFTCALLTFY